MPPCARPPLVRSTAIAVSPVVPAEPGGAHEQIHRRVHRRTSTDSRAQVTPLPLSQMAPVFKGDSINHEKRTPRTRGWHGSTVVRRLPSPSRLPHPLSYLSLSSPSPSLFSLPLTLALSLSLYLSPFPVPLPATATASPAGRSIDVPASTTKAPHGPTARGDFMAYSCNPHG